MIQRICAITMVTASLIVSQLPVEHAFADDAGDASVWRHAPSRENRSVDVTAVSQPNGVDYGISVSQRDGTSRAPIAPVQRAFTAPGTGGKTFDTGTVISPSPNVPGVAVTFPGPSTTGASAPAAAQGKAPDDPDPPYGHSPKDNEYTVTGLQLKSLTTGPAGNTESSVGTRPTGAVPAFTADGQFQGLVTLPGVPVPATAAATPDAVVPPVPALQPAAVAAAPPSGGGGPDPRDIAMDIRGHVPLPDIQIGVNPSPAGIVAIPSWYWVKGYDGNAFGASRTVDIPAEIGAEVPIEGPGAVPADDPRRQGTSFSVEVHIAPTSYQWSFGDGSALDGHSLGQAYPATSDIQHTYQYSSVRQPGGFPVSMTVTFSADYRVDGGAPQGLPPITRTSQMTYRVQEIQTVLTSR